MTDYAKIKNSDLQALLKDRGLPHTGNKADLVARLKEDDSKKAASKDLRSSNAPSGAAPLEDEIDWDDDADVSKKPVESATEAAESVSANAKQGEAPVETGRPHEDMAKASSPAPGATSIAGNAAADATAGQVPPNADAISDTQAPSAPTDAKGDTEKAKAPAVDFSSGLAVTDVDAELAKRKARAAKFGVSADTSEETKKLERAKKFGTSGSSESVKGLDQALPERREKRKREDAASRGSTGGERGGKAVKRGGPGPRRESERKEGGESRAQKGDGSLPGWMGDADREKAERRRAKFGAGAQPAPTKA